MAYTWHSFAASADKWLVEYSLPPFTGTPKFFAMGFAVELYLKAVHIKINNDVEMAMKAGHDIAKLLGECKAADAAFLRGYELRKVVLDANPLQKDVSKVLTKDDFFHFLKHQSLYIAANFKGDLKYLGTRLKNVKGPHAYTFIYPEVEYWIPLLREIRGYLGHPQVIHLDWIQHHLDEQDLPEASMNFLKKLYK